MSKDNSFRKEIEGRGIFYTAWKQAMQEKYPITDQHIGQAIRLADDPSNRRYILLKIHGPGEPKYPEGGYEIDHPDFPYPQSIFLDAAITFPPKRNTSNSQLSRKKVKTKTAKSKTTKVKKKRKTAKKKQK